MKPHSVWKSANRAAGLLAALCMIVLSSGNTADAAELVMFEEDGCSWCAVWQKEVGNIYHKTPEARLASLRRVDIHATRPQDLRDLKPIVYSPNFVLMDEGREVGRILGYPGVDHFWALLGELLGKLETPAES